MALITRIRKNFWLLVVAIGFGLGGFIVMDMFSGQTSIFGSSQFTLGEIEGKKIHWNEFSNIEQVVYSGSADPFGSRSSLWDFYVEKTLLEEEAAALGLNVSKEELINLQFGPDNRLSPVIIQRYSDPNTRQLNRQALTQLRTIIENNQISDYVRQGQLRPEFRFLWAHQEKEIVKERLKSKIISLVSKSLYTPTWMAQSLHEEQNTKVDFAYVQIPFAEIDDTEVQVSEDDLNTYLQENMNKFEQEEETRKVNYITFEVLPTSKDSATLLQDITETAGEWRETEDDSLFVDNNYGTIQPGYSKKEALSPVVADSVFNLPAGTVYGPFQEEGDYRVVKVMDRIVIPDSVKSRHILLRAEDQQQFITASQTIDSLKGLLESGKASFDSLAMKFSQDGGSAAKGGDLGYATPGMMVAPYNNFIFYDGEVGKPDMVITNFGIHLVEILDRAYGTNEEGIKLATIREPIIPSQRTQDSIYEIVLEFVGENRSISSLQEAAAADPDLELETSAALKENDYSIFTLGSGQSSRDLIRWAFDGKTDVGEVSPDIYIYEDEVELFNSKYVVAALKSIQPAGKPKLDNVREEIEPLVRNQKKAEIIKSRINSTDLRQVASNFDVDVDTARSIAFSATFVPGVGSEPLVIAEAFKLELNTVSEPIVGNNGVYLIKPTFRPAVTGPSNLAMIRQANKTTAQSQVRGNLMPALKDNAEIKDYRSKFY